MKKSKISQPQPVQQPQPAPQPPKSRVFINRLPQSVAINLLLSDGSQEMVTLYAMERRSVPYSASYGPHLDSLVRGKIISVEG